MKILQAAVKLFARQGYHKTTMTDLAQAIQLTTGAIFHYFPTKEALLEGVVNWLARGIRIYSNLIENAQEGSLQLVEEIIRVMCEHYHRNPEATICLAALATEFAGSNHPMEERLKQVYDLFVEAFAKRLQSHPRISDPRAAAIAFLGSVQGIAIQGLLRESEYTIDQLAHGLVSMLAEWK